MPVNDQIAGKLKDWLDEAAKDAFGNLFNVLRADELSEQRPGDSEKLFEIGVKRLVSDYKHAMQAIDSGTFG